MDLPINSTQNKKWFLFGFKHQTKPNQTIVDGIAFDSNKWNNNRFKNMKLHFVFDNKTLKIHTKTAVNVQYSH